MPRKRKVTRGGSLTQRILKSTKVLSRVLKFIGSKDSALHKFGSHLEKYGYGRRRRRQRPRHQHMHLLGRLRLL
jgi:hypothetical protein